MKGFKEHTAYNTSAILLISFLLILSINLFSSSTPIGFMTAVLSLIVSIVFIGIVGIFVNLAEPQDGTFSIQNADEPANKWATYLSLNFIVLLLVYLAGNGLCAGITTGSRPIAAYLMDLGLSFGVATWLTTIASSIAATSVVFTICKYSGKIVDELPKAAAVFIITNLVCAPLFYFLHFYAFD